MCVDSLCPVQIEQDRLGSTCWFCNQSSIMFSFPAMFARPGYVCVCIYMHTGSKFVTVEKNRKIKSTIPVLAKHFVCVLQKNLQRSIVHGVLSEARAPDERMSKVTSSFHLFFLKFGILGVYSDVNSYIMNYIRQEDIGWIPIPTKFSMRLIRIFC